MAPINRQASVLSTATSASASSSSNDSSPIESSSVFNISPRVTTSVRKSFPDLVVPQQFKDPWFQFKLFVVKTKILESGVGVVIGRAFQDCIKSFVNDLLVPPLLYFIPNTSTLRFIVIKQGRTRKRYKTLEEAAFDGAITINYGRFSHNCVNFFVVGLSVYYLLKGVKAFFESNLSHLRKCPYCISEVPVEATRCSFCTSELDPIVTANSESRSRKNSLLQDRTSDWFDAKAIKI
ncbi:hypothetical protein BDR26DRAFT_862613 [Obelidium mucronatum]|nr:hypothetical protein BDR26DRAFT_862613 [Obelidium mucronatum]